MLTRSVVLILVLAVLAMFVIDQASAWGGYEGRRWGGGYEGGRRWGGYGRGGWGGYGRGGWNGGWGW